MKGRKPCRLSVEDWVRRWKLTWNRVGLLKTKLVCLILLFCNWYFERNSLDRGNERVWVFFLSHKYVMYPSMKYSSVMVFVIDGFDRHWVWICTFCVRVVILEYTPCPVLLMLHYFSDMTKWDLRVSMLKIDLGLCMIERFVKWSRFVDHKIICSFMLYSHDTP